MIVAISPAGGETGGEMVAVGGRGTGRDVRLAEDTLGAFFDVSQGAADCEHYEAR